MDNNHFYNLREGLIADMKEMCNKLTDISNNCRKMYETYINKDNKLAIRWEKYSSDLLKIKESYLLCINKLSNLSEKYLQECYDNEIILSESINSFTHELDSIKKEYPDIFF